MPITIKKRDTYRWTVRHPIAQKHGKLETIDFDLEFKAMSRTQVEELLKRTGEALSVEEDNRFLEALVAGWHDVRDESGEAVPFDLDALISLCEMYPGLRSSMASAWVESVSGAISGAGRKN